MTAQASAATATQAIEHDRRLFWGCFIALIATSFGFIARVLTADAWGAELGLTATQVGEILGAGLWPFAISIILFSLVIDSIGYKFTMWFGLACHIAAALLVLVADSYATMYLATFILALGNGTVEAYINPVVATVFTREKTKWLNILHAGWPGGLVLGGIIAILLGLDWRLTNAIVLLPAAVYAVMLGVQRFPVHERVTAGISYRAMLREVGAIGALIAAALIILQLGQVSETVLGFSDSTAVTWTLIAIATIAYGAYTRSFGRPLLILFLLVMFPLATTELGVDSWITSFMEGEMTALGMNPGWVLIYTSAIMLVLRFFAGGIAHFLSPLGLLAACAAIAAVGLFTLSAATGAMILVAATLYGIGKTFFWPTTLAVVADQSPRGGALTINLVAGVGMLAVGIVGAPFMGAMQDRAVDENLAAAAPQLYDRVIEPRSSIFGDYEGLNAGSVAVLSNADQETIDGVVEASQKDALRSIAVLPVAMMLVYIALFVYFRSKGGYRAATIVQEEPAVDDSSLVHW